MPAFFIARFSSFLTPAPTIPFQIISFCFVSSLIRRIRSLSDSPNRNMKSSSLNGVGFFFVSRFVSAISIPIIAARTSPRRGSPGSMESYASHSANSRLSTAAWVSPIVRPICRESLNH